MEKYAGGNAPDSRYLWADSLRIQEEENRNNWELQWLCQQCIEMFHSTI